jgi:hypothetical protein
MLLIDYMQITTKILQDIPHLLHKYYRTLVFALGRQNMQVTFTQYIYDLHCYVMPDSGRIAGIPTQQLQKIIFLF